jgi:hypothetical protein
MIEKLDELPSRRTLLVTDVRWLIQQFSRFQILDVHGIVFMDELCPDQVLIAEHLPRKREFTSQHSAVAFHNYSI